MKLVWAHVRAESIALLRLPHYTVFTLIFPMMVFLFFGVPYGRSPSMAPILMASFAAYGTVGVVLFQFAVGIAEDRTSPWYYYLRTLPLRATTVMAARVLTTMLYACVTAAGVVVEAYLLTPVTVGPGALLKLTFSLMLGSLPFAALGFALGFWTHPRAIVPLANLVYLPLSYAGGLWTPPEFLPSWVQGVAPYLPTYRYGQVVWHSVLGRPWQAEDWLYLLGYTVALSLLALWGYHRDQGVNYRA